MFEGCTATIWQSQNGVRTGVRDIATKHLGNIIVASRRHAVEVLTRKGAESFIEKGINPDQLSQDELVEESGITVEDWLYEECPTWTALLEEYDRRISKVGGLPFEENAGE